ncbi:MAG: PAS domain S-box protein [Nitrosomonadales bacterium]|nr:PAS domain S-box protein [Nitrosomonadales bacterium]
MKHSGIVVADLFENLEQARMGVAHIGLDGRWLRVNRAFRDLTGYAPEELHAMVFTEVTPFEDLGEHLQNFRRLFSGELTNFHAEKRLIRKNAQPIWVNLTVVLLKDAHNSPDSFFAFFEDITARKQSDADDPAPMNRYAHLFNQMPDSVVLFDTGCRVIGFNRKALQQYGYSAEEMLALGVTDLEVRDDPQTACMHRDLILLAGSDEFVSRHRTRRGRILDVQVSVQVVNLPDGEKIFQALFHDITEQTHWEQHLVESEERLELALDSAEEGMWDWHIPSGRLEVSEQWHRMLGYRSGSFTSIEDWRLLCHPEDMPELERRLQAHFNGETPLFEYEHRLRRHDGGWVWVLGKAKVVQRDPQGNPLRIVGTNVNITASKHTEDALRQEIAKNQLLFKTASDGLHIMDARGNLLQASDSFCRMLGFTQEEMRAMNVLDWDAKLPPDTDFELLVNRMGSEGKVLETQQRRKDGRLITVEISTAAVDVQGTRYVYASARDITERKRTEESMRLSAAIYKNSNEAILVTDEQNLIVDANPAFTAITGYALADVLGRDPRLLQSGRHDKEFYRLMWHAILNEGHWQGEIWDKRKNGEIYPKWSNISVIRHPDGRIYRHVAQFADITEKKKKEDLIWHQANYDALTGLPNRRLFRDRLEQELKKSHRTGQPLALIFIDLDRFKEINDTLGHDVGDLLLVEAAQRIVRCVRDTDTVARLGGDEFTVILPEFGEAANIERIVQNIIRDLTAPFNPKGETCYISASIGITLYPYDADNLDDLMKHADQAMYVAKEEGRNRFSYYTASMQQKAMEKLSLTNELRHALERRELQVYYQPIVSLADGRIHKAEALLRWNHPQRGTISPVVFIPLAEESGSIHKIGAWVFHESMACILRLRDQLGRDIQISVNKSPVQFIDQSNRDTWMDERDRLGLSQNSIAVEITEGLLLKDSSQVKALLDNLNERGVQISLDDFGTGFSSLSYLKKFPVDYLKIDRSFIRHLTENESDKALTEAIIVMAHKLGMQTIAEGVETEQQRDLLLKFGCDYAQGCWFSHPLPEEEFTSLLRAAG